MTFDEKFPDQYKREEPPKERAPESGNGGAISTLLVAVTLVSIVLSFVAIAWNPSKLAEGMNIFSDPAMGRVWMMTLALLLTYAILLWGVRKLGRLSVGKSAEKTEGKRDL